MAGYTYWSKTSFSLPLVPQDPRSRREIFRQCTYFQGPGASVVDAAADVPEFAGERIDQIGEQ